MKKIFTKTLIMVVLCATTSVGHTQWSLSGNAASSTSVLGTTNSVSLNLITKNSRRLIIDTLGHVGINTNPALSLLTLKGAGTLPASSWISSGAPLFAGFGETTPGNADFNLMMAATVANARGVLGMKRARGTLAAPAAVAINDQLGSLLVSGFDGTNFQGSAAVDFFADGTPTAGNVPARISFVTGTNGSNRTERLKIGSTGDVSVTTGNLLMNAGKTLQFANPTATSPGMMTMFASGTANAPRMVIAHSPAYPSWGLQYVDSVDKFDFLQGGSSVMAVNLGVNTGLNLNLGNFTLANGYQTIQFATPTVGGAPMMTMFPDGTANPTRMLFAHSAAYPSWGLQYNDTLDQFDFVAYGVSGLNINPYSGNISVKNTVYAPYVAATATSTSSLITSYNYGAGNGIYGYTAGGTSSDPYGLSGVYGYNAGIGYGVGGYGTTGSGTYGYSSNYTGVWGSTGNSGSYAGYFQGNVYTTGIYSSSDRKLKKNIEDMTGGMDIISKLKPRTYEFKQDGNYKLMNLPEGKQYGLVAQELEEVLPNLVKQSEFDPNMVKNIGKPAPQPTIPTAGGDKQTIKQPTVNDAKQQTVAKEEKIDFKAVNYTELIPIMIKGMQEQQAIINDQNARIAALTELVEALSPGAKSVLAASAVRLTSATMDQNVPNPPVNNNTRISYNIPEGASKAEMIVADVYGKKLKQIPLNNKGKGQLNVDTTGLASGTYTYSLFVDGKMIETKKMIVQ